MWSVFLGDGKAATKSIVNFMKKSNLTITYIVSRMISEVNIGLGVVVRAEHPPFSRN